MAGLDKQHMLVGGILLVGGIYLVSRIHAGNQQQATTTDPASGAAIQQPQLASVPTLQQGGTDVPGTDIKIGGSPSYMTYNYPAYYGSSDQGQGQDQGQGNCSGCCGGCSQNDCQQEYWTLNQLMQNYKSPSQQMVNNLRSIRYTNLPNVGSTF